MSWLIVHLPLAVTLNAYAFLLDFMAAAAFCAGGAAVLNGAWITACACAALGIFFLSGGIGVHQTYGEKLRLHFILERRNKKAIRPESFKEYLDVPCQRLVVRSVLCRLGHKEKYREVMKSYYRWPWQRFSSSEDRLIFTNEEDAKRFGLRTYQK